MKKIWAVSIFSILMMPLMGFADEIRCTERDYNIYCSLDISQYIENSRQLLTNGWKNTFQIDIALMDYAAQKVIQKSRLEAVQRCYLDPFESPCLILWKGAKSYQRYRDEEVFLNVISKFGIQALTVSELPAGNYVIRIDVQISENAAQRVETMKSWLKQGNGEMGILSIGTGALLTNVFSHRTQEVEDNVSSKKIVLQTTPFYIDVGEADSFGQEAGRPENDLD